MPIYEFECPIHGIFERLFPLRLYKEICNGILCEYPISEFGKGIIKEDLYCGETAEKIWSLPGNIQIAPPTRVFISPKTNQAQVAISQYDKPPVGYIEKELKDPIQRSKFEKEDNARVHIQDEVDTYKMDQRRQSHQKLRHDELKSKMNSLQTEVHPDTGEKIKHFLEPQTKFMLKKAMEHSNKKRVPKKETVRKLAVNHYNSSNLADAPKVR